MKRLMSKILYKMHLETASKKMDAKTHIAMVNEEVFEQFRHIIPLTSYMELNNRPRINAVGIEK